MLKARRNKAQSTLEYIVVLTAIIGVIIYAATRWIGPGVDKSLNNARDTIVNSSNILATNLSQN